MARSGFTFRVQLELNDDLSPSLAARDLHLRRKMWDASGEERLAAMQEILTRHGVPFVVIGGHAVVFHAELPGL